MNLLKIARTPAVTALPETSVYQAALKMAEDRVGAIVVVSPSNSVTGIFTERDNLFRVTCQGLDPKATHLSEVMTARVVTVPADMDPEAALSLMIRNRFRHLPIVDSTNRVVGLASIRHLLMRRIGEQNAGLETLAAYVSAGGPG